MNIGVQEYILKSQFDLDTLLVRIRKCIGAGGQSSVIEEISDEVVAASAPTMEIAGEMEAAAPRVG